jgi:hypothetical protein
MTDPDHSCEFPLGYGAAGLPGGIFECPDCHRKYKIIDVQSQEWRPL